MKGFTLIELLIVVAILSILATITLPLYAAHTEKAKDSVCTANRIILKRGFLTELSLSSASDETNETFQAYLQNNYEMSVICPCGTTSEYTWDSQTHSVLCPYHGNRVYDILLTSTALPKTMEEIYSSFDVFLAQWMQDEGKLPLVNQSYASLSWNAANYTGTDKTNLFQAKFWNDYFSLVDVEDFNSTNPTISDFKIFFKRDSYGVVTSEPAGVYLQIGGSRMIRFSDETVVSNKHYSTYIDPVTKELTPP
ncbi:MAG: pilin [Clostridia bacterium]|nr:pilin [Clostridia bacterium]